jgi:hypothetical protein
MNAHSTQWVTRLRHGATRRFTVVGVTAAVLSAGLGAAIAGATAERGPPDRPSDAQAAALSVFRQEPAADVPAAVASLGDDSELAQTYMPNPRQSRVTFPHGDRADGWYVVPGADSGCAYSVKRHGGACASMDDVEHSGLLIWGVAPGTDRAGSVFGVVPDDVTSATVVGADGRKDADLDGNVVQATGRNITELELQTDDGTRRVAFGG